MIETVDAMEGATMRGLITGPLLVLVGLAACSSDSNGEGGGTSGAGANGGSGGTADAGGTGGATGGSSGIGGATGGSSGSGGTAAAGGSGASGTAGASGVGGTSGTGGTSGSSGAGGQTGGAAGAGGHAIVLPTGNAAFDYQIGGAYTPPSGVQVVSRDREDSPAPGIYNICYVNGFQTQPQDEDWWLDNHPDLILRDGNGDPVEDESWGEFLLDIGTPAKRSALVAIVGPWIEKCAADGFDAVEIDNLDSYSRSEGLLQPAHAVTFMGMLSSVAHASGLASAQKNSTELLGDAVAMGTDFAVAEECNRWNECADYVSVYGNLVFVIEYRKQDFDAGCANFEELSIVLRDLAVSTPSSGSYVYDGC